MCPIYVVGRSKTIWCRWLSGAPSRKGVAKVGIHVKYIYFYPQTRDRDEKWLGSSVTAVYRNAKGVK